MRISKDLSAYLDLLRFLAALAVLLGHMDQDGISIRWFPLSHYSHEAVVVFFVLSGFIIYNNTFAVGLTAKDYAIARISRIYSVAIPAVAFSVLVALLIHHFSPGRQPSNYSPFQWGDVVSSLLFLNQSWMNSAHVTMNDPYWSLCYEVWFYVMFGAFVFAKGWARVALVGISTLIAGPAILLLLPAWLFGAWAAARWMKGVRWSSGIAFFLFFLAPVLMVAVNLSGMDLLIRDTLKELVPAMWRLKSSQRFVTDGLLGSALALHLLAFSSLPSSCRLWLAERQKSLSQLASFSFTLYLFHRPMTQVIGMYFPSWGESRLGAVAVAIGILLICWLVSFVTERQLPWWRQRVRSLFAANWGRKPSQQA